MSAPTIAVDWLLARAAVRSTGLLHVVSRRDSGALNPMCAANPIRSEQIEEHTSLATVADMALLCEDCASRAASIGGTVRDGVALLLGLSAAVTTTRMLEISVDEIDAADDHARRSPGAEIEAFVDSVRQRGIVTPLVVRRHGAGFLVIDGVRRLYAARVAGLATVPAVVRDTTDEDALVDGLVANLHRADLNPIEQAHAYRAALAALDCSKADLGRRLSISRSQISNTIRLLDLPDEDQAAIAAGTLTAQGGRALLAGPRPVQVVLPDVAQVLATVLATKVRVTHSADTARITIDVPDEELARVLEQLGVPAAPAAAAVA